MISCIKTVKNKRNIVAQLVLEILIKGKQLINLNDCDYFIIYIWESFLQLGSHQD